MAWHYPPEIIDAYESWKRASQKLYQISVSLNDGSVDPRERPDLLFQYNLWANRILGLEDEYPEIIKMQDHHEPF